MTKTGGDHITAALIQIGLFIIAAFCFVAAVMQLFGVWSLNVGDEVPKLLGVALVALAFGQITKFKGFGIEIEKQVAQLTDTVGKLEKEVGPGSKSAAAIAGPQAAIAPTQVTRQAADSNDPNKGRFGQKSEANGRKLSARITPAGGPDSSRCRVAVRVESTDAQLPLKGSVTFHLHPSFGRWSEYEVVVEGGVAKDEIVSYGAFTIGVLTDRGPLELDLMDVPGGTPRFYEE
jgi:hypothetical protein